MDFSKARLTCRQARQLDLVSYLATLGYQPAKIRHNDYWYLSPLRQERTPSFKINRVLNRWYDHGTGEGGDLISFALRYHRCSVSALLQQLAGVTHTEAPMRLGPALRQPEAMSSLQIRQASPLRAVALQRYLYQRRIPLDIAAPFCQEVHYSVGDHPYFAIGFKNNSGGYELRSPCFKGSSAPKDLTTIDNGATEVMVFEGFFDFLSHRSIFRHQPLAQTNYLILNSLALFEKARPFLERHAVIHLYLDRDTAGQTCTRAALAHSARYRDESPLYTNYKDLNDWTQNMGKATHKARLQLHV